MCRVALFFVLCLSSLGFVFSGCNGGSSVDPDAQQCGPGRCWNGTTCIPCSDATETDTDSDTTGDCPDILLNEVYYDSGSDSVDFVEIKGQPGTSLNGVTLDGINGNDGESYTSVSLSGTIGESGLFVVGFSDEVLDWADLTTDSTELQLGPDNVVLSCSGQTIDALGYDDFYASDVFVGEGTSANDSGRGKSLSRCPNIGDSNDNSADFHPAVPTPGTSNDGFDNPAVCLACIDGRFSSVVINEVVYNPDGSDSSSGLAFVEILAAPNQSLLGLALWSINGSDGNRVGQPIGLTGTADENGLYVIAQSEAVANYDQVEAKVDFQNGPDNIILVDASCGDVVIDALGYGNFGPTEYFQGEGSAAPSTGDGNSLARCPGKADTGDNAADFHEADTPTPGEGNSAFIDPLACIGCEGGLAGRVVINEVMYDKPGNEGDTSLAFVELRAVLAGDEVDLTGAYIGLHDTSGNLDKTIPILASIPQDGYFVIAESEDVANWDIIDDVDFVNSAASIVLYDCADNPIDAMGYGSFGPNDTFMGETAPAPSSGDGNSLGRCPEANDTGNNAADFDIITDVSPGTVNAAESFSDPFACAPCESGVLSGHVIINEVLFNPPGSDGGSGLAFIELRGDVGLNLTGAKLVPYNSSGTPSSAIPLNGSIGSDELDYGFYLVAQSDQVLPGHPELIDQITPSADLGNGPNSLALLDCDDVVVDAVGYGNYTDMGGFKGETAPFRSLGGDGDSLARCPEGVDTNDNSKDFAVSNAPTPRDDNANFSSPGACGQCIGGALAGKVVINEVLYDEAGADTNTFIELRGEAGTDLTGTKLVPYNGSGVAGTPIELTGAIGVDGFYLVAQASTVLGDPNRIDLITSAADLGNGPNSLALLDCADTVVDAVGYGFTAPDGFMGEGTSSPDPEGNSIARCSGGADTDDNGADFEVANITPRAENDGSFTDPDACGAPGCNLTGVVINEIKYDGDGADIDCYVELKGPANTVLDGSTLVGINGSTGADYNAISLSGTIPGTGYFVIGQSADTVLGANQVDSKVNFQNDNESIQLRDCTGAIVHTVCYEFGAEVTSPCGLNQSTPEAADGESLACCGGTCSTADFEVIAAGNESIGANNNCP